MEMKSAITCSLALAIVMLGFLAAAPTAYAVRANHSGLFCTYYNTSDMTFIEHLTNGIRNHKELPIRVICPLTRNTTNSNGAVVYVNVTHTDTQTTSCTAYSWFRDGRVKAVSGGASAVPGSRTIQLNLSGTNNSDSLSAYSVACDIAGNNKALIHSITLDEK
jgi:hypothetical protein